MKKTETGVHVYRKGVRIGVVYRIEGEQARFDPAPSFSFELHELRQIVDAAIKYFAKTKGKN